VTTHAWHDLIHLAAALVLTVGGGIVIARGWRNRSSIASVEPEGGRASPPTEAVVARFLSLLLVALSLGAAAIHFAAAPEHLDELGVLGIGFPLAAILQAMWAAAWSIRPTNRTASLGIVLNGSIAFAWAWSRIVGLPAGEAPWQPEPLGMPDVASTLFEVAIVVLLIARLTARDLALARRARDLATVATVALVPPVGVVFLATLLAINVAAGGGAPHGGHGAP
jgi:hypothetical protein